jgi:hypothetical protein
MRITTLSFFVEKRQLVPAEEPANKEEIYRCREWLGTSEGRNRNIVFEHSNRDLPKFKPRQSGLSVVHFSVAIENYLSDSDALS